MVNFLKCGKRTFCHKENRQQKPFISVSFLSHNVLFFASFFQCFLNILTRMHTHQKSCCQAYNVKANVDQALVQQNLFRYLLSVLYIILKDTLRHSLRSRPYRPVSTLITVFQLLVCIDSKQLYSKCMQAIP